MNIGFIGLGLMGRPMALNLRKAGFAVGVWARREASLAPVVAAGAVARGSIAEVAAAADAVFSCVPDAPQVAEVLGITPEAARKRRQRAREALARVFEDERP